ncbi:MAG: histidine kinase dimerization/phospho-acceptor domain-containing protein [Pseudomonadota bacterium]
MNATIRRGIPGCFYDDVFLISKSSMRHGITYWRLVVLTLVGSLSCNGLARDHDIAALADLDRETLQSYLTLDPSDTLVRLLMAERTLSNDLLATAALLDLNRTELNGDQQLYFDALKCQLDLYNGANPQTLAVCNDLSVAEAAAVAPYVAAQAFRGWAMQAFCAEDIGSMLARSRQAVVAARRSESRRALISALNGNAIALHKAGAVDAALRQFEQARLLINPAIDQDLLGRLTFNNGTAQIYAGQGDAAAEVFTAALADPTNKAPTIQLKIRNNLAEAHLLRSDPDAAVSSLEAYLVSLDPDSVSVDALLRARLTLAEAQLRTGNGEGALELHQGSQLQIGRALSPDQSMELKRAVAEAQLSLGNTSVAVSLLEEVTGHFRQQDSGWLLLPALDSLALAYAREARFSDAYAMQLEHAALQASLHSARFDQQLAVQRTQLEADNAEFQQRLRAQEVQARTAKNSLDRTRWASSAMVLALIIALLYLLANRHLRNRELAAKASESEELERLVVERTNDLEKELSARLLLQDERRQLEITLAESDKLRTIGQLTSGVAHDFNNLMTVVTLSAELIDLEADRLSSRQAQALRDIMVATNSAANITSQLLAYARQQPLQPEQLNLRDYLNQSRNLFQSTLGE